VKRRTFVKTAAAAGALSLIPAAGGHAEVLSTIIHN